MTTEKQQEKGRELLEQRRAAVMELASIGVDGDDSKLRGKIRKIDKRIVALVQETNEN